MDPYPEFTDGIALVVGGSGGIGAAISTTLAEAGSNVAILYRSNHEAAAAVAARVSAAGRIAETARCDIADAEAVRHAVDAIVAAWGAFIPVVHAAGPAIEFLYINEIAPDEWARVCGADLNGYFNVVAATLPHLRAQRGGSYVTLVTAAVDRAPPRDILSAAPKAAIEMLTRGIAREEGRSGIRANCVGPGYIEAGLGLSTVHDHTEEYVRRMVRAIPLGRAGQAQDVADVVCFLLSDKARYVTGETIAVAGGLQLV